MFSFRTPRVLRVRLGRVGAGGDRGRRGLVTAEWFRRGFLLGRHVFEGCHPAGRVGGASLRPSGFVAVCTLWAGEFWALDGWGAVGGSPSVRREVCLPRAPVRHA